jgi:predicted Rossmann fold nucleotide-binding protein DprA/Smf involved in DNA uptake
MSISTQTQAVLLLTAWFSKPAKDAPKPLTPSEWGSFALWLKEKGLTPEVLVDRADPSPMLEGWTHRSVDASRIRHLLGRSAALGIALEKWERAGLWVMTRSDADYPRSLKHRLKLDAPPVLFGCGDRQLLGRGGIAVVGSRDASPDVLAFTAELGSQIALQGYSVVSGGARGVDEAAMLAALEKDGTVIGVLSDNLLRASSSARYRRALMDGNAVLVSPFNPEAGFDVGNAMARNKYIYCLASAAVVAGTSKGKGGTWNGAIENLKRGWVPLWVKSTDEQASGNATLVELGARWLPERSWVMGALVGSRDASIPSSIEAEVGDQSTPSMQTGVREESSSFLDVSPAMSIPQDAPVERTADEAIGEARSISAAPLSLSMQLSLYEFFLRKLDAETASAALSADALQERLGLGKTQLTDWLKRAVSEGRVEKLGKRARYRTSQAAQQTLNL